MTAHLTRTVTPWPGEWVEHAACADHPTDLWFNPGRVRDARRICFACPVRDACLDYALVNRVHDGMWGGLTERQRVNEARTRRIR